MEENNTNSREALPDHDEDQVVLSVDEIRTIGDTNDGSEIEMNFEVGGFGCSGDMRR